MAACQNLSIMFRAIVILPDGSSDGSPLGPVGSQTPKLLTVRADRSLGHGSQDMVQHCSPPPHPDLLQTPLVLHPSCMWETHLQGLAQVTELRTSVLQGAKLAQQSLRNLCICSYIMFSPFNCRFSAAA